MNQRTALKDTILPMGGGPDRKAPVLIHRGASVAFSVYSLHRRKDFYGEDSEEFRPERWNEDIGLYKDDVTRTWGYLPFNGGPRICLGSMYSIPWILPATTVLIPLHSGLCFHRSSLRGCENTAEISYD